jgi:NADH dehydrogenase
VGGGPTGVELSAEIQELVKGTFSRYYPPEIINDVSVVLIQRGSELVPQFGIKIRKKSLEVLQKKGIEVMLNSAVKEIGNSYVVINNDIKILTETVIWVAGIKPANLKFDQPIKQSPDGKLIVNEYLQLEDHKEVFILGDMASFKDTNKNIFLPALAQVAQKEAITAAKNIELSIKGKSLQKFSYHSSGSLMSLGKWMAVGEIANFSFSGFIAWWIWRTIYLSKLISFKKRTKVAIDWTVNFFSPRDISLL